jgi:hypothetical protein
LQDLRFPNDIAHRIEELALVLRARGEAAIASTEDAIAISF